MKRSKNGRWSLLGLAAFPLLGFAQADGNAAEDRFEIIATQPDVQLTQMSASSRVESADSVASITAVEAITTSGERVQGVNVLLENSEQTHTLNLDVEAALQFQQEYAALAAGHEEGRRCAGAQICVQGIARCRPSQTQVQPFCPAIYWSAEGEAGVSLAAGGRSFRFPSAHATDFSIAMAEAIGSLDDQIDRDE